MRPPVPPLWGRQEPPSAHQEEQQREMDESSSDSGDSNASSLSTSPVKPPPQQARVPALGLNLGVLPRSGQDGATPDSARPPLPKLGLKLPPPGLGGGGDAPLTSRRHAHEPAGQAQPAAAPAATLAVDLLSPGFALAPPQQGGAAEAQQQCAERLGVAPGRLRYYALVQAASPAELPPGCARVAVEVVGSKFSLEALEELLRENKELAAAAAAGEVSGAAAEQQRPLKEHLSASKQIAKVAQARVAKLESALQREQTACRELQHEVAALRRQLKKSEELRQRGQRALDDLKHEFEALQRELVFDGAALAAQQDAAAPMSPPVATSSMVPSPMASTPGEASQQAHSDRLATLLGRLCESATLDKLEELVNRLQT